jgi:hypothetical protein
LGFFQVGLSRTKGWQPVPTGQLREIGIEAQRIAKAAKALVARAA